MTRETAERGGGTVDRVQAVPEHLCAMESDTLTPQAARYLLLSIAPGVGDYIDDIVTLCCHRASLVRLAGSVLAVGTNTSPVDVIQRLRATRDQADMRKALLQFSYDGLDSETKRLWTFLSVFPDSFDLSAAVDVCGVTADACESTLDHLSTRGIVDRHAGLKRCRMDSAARTLAEVRGDDCDLESARGRHAKYYDAALKEMLERDKWGCVSVADLVGWLELEGPNLEAAESWAVTRALADQTTLSSTVLNGQARRLACMLKLDPHKRILQFEAALSEARERGDRRAEANHLADLGRAHGQLEEEPQAITYLEQASRVFDELGALADQAACLSNLGTAYRRVGESRRAIDCHQAALRIAVQLRDHRGQLYALGNLGLAYIILGESRRALECFDEYLRLAVHLQDRRAEANALGDLGNIHRGLGDIQRAASYYTEQLAIARVIGDRLGQGNALGSLSRCRLAEGLPEVAAEYASEYLSIARELGHRYAEEHAWENLGHAHLALGSPQRALEAFSQQLLIATQIDHRRGEGNAQWNLSLALRASGVHAEAAARATAALRILKAIEDPSFIPRRTELEGWI